MPTVLVIGAGFAGISFAKAASKLGLDVTIVDSKDFFAVTFASLRSVVQPSSAVAAGMLWSYSQVPGIGRFVQGQVVGLSKRSAVLAGGQEIGFDYAVIATGAINSAGVFTQPQSLTIDGRRQELKDTAAQISAARSIIVVGAGFVGVELAAEIVEAYAGKRVTLICSGPRLFEGKPRKVGDTAAAWLKSHKVEIIYSEKAIKKTEVTVELKSGTDLTADLVIWATGAKPNTGFLQSTELAATLNEAGRIQVDPTLRIIGFENMFALGDVNDVKEEKLGYLAMLQGQLTAKNLAALAKKKDAKLTAWVPSNGMPGAFVTLGSKTGTGSMGSCVLPGCMVGMMKSKGLFVNKVRDDWGVKA